MHKRLTGATSRLVRDLCTLSLASLAFVHVGRAVCTDVCRRAISSRLLYGCSCQVFRGRYTVSLAFDRCLCMRNERYVLKRSGLFIQ